jgi:hypothetical protein
LSRFRPLKRTFTCILLPILLSPIPVFINTPVSWKICLRITNKHRDIDIITVQMISVLF